MRASISIFGAAVGETPIAIASAIMPSMRPVLRFFESLRLALSFLLPSLLPSTTALAAHMLRHG